jgi:hypothetical protein
MVWSRKIRQEDLPDEWSTWVYAHFQSQAARDGFMDSVALFHDTGWCAKAMPRDVRGARVCWRKGSFLRLNDLAYAHGGRIVVG